MATQDKPQPKRRRKPASQRLYRIGVLYGTLERRKDMRAIYRATGKTPSAQAITALDVVNPLPQPEARP